MSVHLMEQTVYIYIFNNINIFLYFIYINILTACMQFYRRKVKKLEILNKKREVKKNRFKNSQRKFPRAISA